MIMGRCVCSFVAVVTVMGENDEWMKRGRGGGGGDNRLDKGRVGL